MPRPGYRSLSLSDSLFQTLKRQAALYGTSPQNLIAAFVESPSGIDAVGATPVTASAATVTRIVPQPPSRASFGNQPHQLFQQTAPPEVGKLPPCTVQDFKRHLDVVLQRPKCKCYVSNVRCYLRHCSYEPSRESAIAYLETIKNPYTYQGNLKALRHFFGSFLRRPDIIEGFKYPDAPPPARRLRSKEELQSFFGALPTLNDQALFLALATTGLRRSETLMLTRPQIDLATHAITPGHSSRTKSSYVSFYNEEAAPLLAELLKSGKNRPFARWSFTITQNWHQASSASGVEYMTPQDLRFWFSNEMARLGVADRYVDAFQGRVPRSVIANHYSDYSPERLKEIYDKAGLRVLE